MGIILTGNLQKIPVVDNMYKMWAAYDMLPVQKDISVLIYDAVVDFVNNIFTDLDEIEKAYIVRLFYCAKGTTEVLELLRDKLNVITTYDYNVTNLTITVEEVTTTDPNLLDYRFKAFLNWLLYFLQLEIDYKTLIYIIQATLDKLYNKTQTITYREFIEP